MGWRGDRRRKHELQMVNDPIIAERSQIIDVPMGEDEVAERRFSSAEMGEIFRLPSLTSRSE
jgi:hypothetical protein